MPTPDLGWERGDMVSVTVNGKKVYMATFTLAKVKKRQPDNVDPWERRVRNIVKEGLDVS